MALARINLRLISRTIASVASRSQPSLLPVVGPRRQPLVAALRRFSLSAARWNEGGKKEVERQELGRLEQVITQMQLTYTCKICNTRQGGRGKWKVKSYFLYLFKSRSGLWIRIRMDPHLFFPPGSGSRRKYFSNKNRKNAWKFVITESLFNFSK